jgi:hypothetical protein
MQTSDLQSYCSKKAPAAT